MLEFDCHPEQAFFARRGIWASRAKQPALSQRSAPKGRALCDAIIARLARFLMNHSLDRNERFSRTENS